MHLIFYSLQIFKNKSFLIAVCRPCVQMLIKFKGPESTDFVSLMLQYESFSYLESTEGTVLVTIN